MVGALGKPKRLRGIRVLMISRSSLQVTVSVTNSQLVCAYHRDGFGITYSRVHIRKRPYPQKRGDWCEVALAPGVAQWMFVGQLNRDS